MKLPKVDTQYGAPMGRLNRSWTTADWPKPRSLKLTAVALDSGGYDNGGAYWGHAMDGTRLYCLHGENVLEFVRAKTRKEAADQLKLPYWALAKPLPRSHIFYNQHDQPFRVEVIRKDEYYGNGAVKADKDLVVFSYRMHPFPAYGLAHLLEQEPPQRGLLLCGSDPTRWTLDEATMEQITDWLRHFKK